MARELAQCASAQASLAEALIAAISAAEPGTQGMVHVLEPVSLPCADATGILVRTAARSPQSVNRGQTQMWRDSGAALEAAKLAFGTTQAATQRAGTMDPETRITVRLIGRLTEALTVLVHHTRSALGKRASSAEIDLIGHG